VRGEELGGRLTHFRRNVSVAVTPIESRPMNAPVHSDTKLDFDAVIVGAGFSGLGMGDALRKAGREDFIILERANAVGGTWRDNTYPGCACDVPSHLYSFSYAQNPNWSRAYSPQGEILSYLQDFTRRSGLESKIRFAIEFRSARFDEASGRWRIETNRAPLIARALILGTGPLNKPAIPKLPGLERFAGRVFHSSEWDHDYDLGGKRVAVIGTGASAIQFAPAIQPRVAQLHLFQRTPPWVLPRMDHAFTARAKWIFRNIPLAQDLFRSSIYWSMEMRAFGFTLNPNLLLIIERLARKYLERTVPNPDLRAKVTPDFRIGCKRILISNDYYPSLARKNVELVTCGITQIRENSIVGADGKERAIDAIIFATGFHATDLLGPMEIFGRGGRSLKAEWSAAPEAYYGTTVSGYPNLFLIVGPNTGLGHNSLIYMIEAQVHYVLAALERMDREGAHFMDVRKEVQDTFNTRLKARMAKTVWATGCKSWYLDEQGRNPSLWPSFTFRFKQETQRLKPQEYEFARAPADSQ
jgi:cation diffusion facilitator CzcD-associated flavoprotein CzcO